MSRARGLLPTLLLCACGTSTTLGPPEILSVRPNQVLVTEAASSRVQVSLDAVLPIRVDYGREEAHASPVHVWIGSEEAQVERAALDGTLQVAMPPGLGVGSHDVRVVLADGREGMRPDALTLASTDATDAGDPRCEEAEPRDCRPPTDAGVTFPGEAPLARGDITGFRVEPVGAQRVGEPFLVVIHAEGPRATRFHGTVTMTVNARNGTVGPSTLGPFQDGVLSQDVTVTAHGGNIKLTVTDDLGAQGTSNGFRVR
ncbi:hypothetical protein ACLEPN_01835 [Myxococcus sp. 1LA]